MPVTTVSILKQRRVKIKAPGGGKQAQNLFVSKLSKAAETIAGVNRNLAQHRNRLGTKQVEQMHRRQRPTPCTLQRFRVFAAR